MRVTRWKKAAAGAALIGVVVVAAAATATEVRWTRTFERPYPAIAASSDQEVLARGKYLVYGPAACAHCHVPKEQWRLLDAGLTPPLSGNHVFRLPFGEFFSANVTPDPETGIGSQTDAQLARMLREGVRADGRAAFPLMEYQNVSDADLTAIISFLRSEPPVRNVVPEHRLSALGKTLMAFVIEPHGPQTPPMQTSPVGPSVTRGDYLANHVSACASCHTDRDGRGALVGPRFAGGQRMDVAADATKVYVPPNLTPDPETSPIGRATEAAFIARFRLGERVAGTPMPWSAYGRMTDDDLKSVFMYLRSLPPVRHTTGAVIQDKE